MDPRLTHAVTRAHVDDLRRHAERPIARRRPKQLVVPEADAVAAALSLVGAPLARVAGARWGFGQEPGGR